MSDGFTHIAAWGFKVTTSNMLFHESQKVGGCLIYEIWGGSLLRGLDLGALIRC